MIARSIACTAITMLLLLIILGISEFFHSLLKHLIGGYHISVLLLKLLDLLFKLFYFIETPIIACG
jgi:hypothetical protein